MSETTSNQPEPTSNESEQLSEGELEQVSGGLSTNEHAAPQPADTLQPAPKDWITLESFTFGG
jgi:hypothetical protein